MKDPLSISIYKSIFFVSVFLFVSCDSANIERNVIDADEHADLENLSFTVEEAPEWSELFNRTSGWFGADGIFAIPLDGKRNKTSDSDTETMFVFSETMIGGISDGKMQADSDIVNNSVAYLKGSKPDENAIRFQWAETGEGIPAALFVPDTPSADEGDYYWLGDGFVNTEMDNTIYIFASRMMNLDPNREWSFVPKGTNLIALPAGSQPPFKDQRQIETPLLFDNGGFGAGIYLNTEASGASNPDGYIYVYGVRGAEKNLMVARVLPEDFETFDAWRFWDGENWNADMEQVANVTSNASNELSVSALPDGRYALVFTYKGLGSPTVGLRIGSTPYGPFGPVIDIYQSAENQRENYIAYNAKAHPSLSAPGELLISYNVNAFNFWNEIEANPNLYRPRFIRLKLH